MSPTTFWPSALGFGFLMAGIWTYRGDVLTASSGPRFRVVALGPVFVAASLAAFAGEHFTAARILADGRIRREIATAAEHALLPSGAATRKLGDGRLIERFGEEPTA